MPDPDATRPSESLLSARRRRPHPIQYALCGECLTVSAEDDWLGLNLDDEGRKIMAPPGDEPTFYRCPRCDFDHTDTDDDPGVWSGYQWQMHKQRRELLDERDLA